MHQIKNLIEKKTGEKEQAEMERIYGSAQKGKTRRYCSENCNAKSVLKSTAFDF